jgi:hypothetical protein
LINEVGMIFAIRTPLLWEVYGREFLSSRRVFMKRLFFSLVALSLLYGPGQSRAATVLTFAGLQDLEPILNYYDGGFGGDGSGPGPNYGVIFGSDSLAIIQEAAGGSGNFINNPTGVTVAFFLSGPGDVMDVPGGFNTGFSFYYSAPYYPGSVTVWSGLDGTGTLLATLDLALTPMLPGPYDYDDWVAQGVSFSGTAESAIFSGTANYIGLMTSLLGVQPLAAAAPSRNPPALFSRAWAS